MMSEEELRALRKQLGTLRPAASIRTGRLARLWNWLIDADYVTVGPPPWAWIAFFGAVFGLIAAVWYVGITASL